MQQANANYLLYCHGHVPLTVSIFYGSLGTECRTLVIQRF
jgi:hypothetical protein